MVWRGLPWVPPPPSRPGQGGTPGTPHYPGLGWGTPLNWDGVPYTQTWDRVPQRPGMGYPPPMVNRQTFPSININFPCTTYTGGNNYYLGISCFRCRIFKFDIEVEQRAWKVIYMKQIICCKCGGGLKLCLHCASLKQQYIFCK